VHPAESQAKTTSESLPQRFGKYGSASRARYRANEIYDNRRRARGHWLYR